MRLKSRLSPIDSNNFLQNLVEGNEPFLISRVGLGGETIVSAFTLAKQTIPQQGLYFLYNNAGFYGTNDTSKFSKMYVDACRNCNAHVYWHSPGFIEMEDLIVPHEKTLLDPSCLESFRFETPWTKSLKGKKVLIINPFKQEIDSQLENKHKIWSNAAILSGDYITYKSVQSIGGEGPHRDWYDSFDIMCNDISQIEFDVALLGCGAYGLPLANYIKQTLNKSAIYVGGGLQLYFGIIGKRWENDKDIIKNRNEHWIRPNPTKNLEKVEGGCYW